MSIEAELFSVLRTTVSDRVYPTVFPQPLSGLPVWPAIRYSIVSSTPVEDLCGDGDDTTADVRVQIDAVDVTYSKMLTLRLAVMEAMRALPTPARLAQSSNDYDDETKTHRAVLEYECSGSSDPEVDSP